MIRQYKIDVLTQVANNYVKSDCADITFYNQGDTIIKLNQAITISPGNSVSFNANENEVDRTIYNFQFDLTTGTTNQLVIIRKIYI